MRVNSELMTNWNEKQLPGMKTDSFNISAADWANHNPDDSNEGLTYHYINYVDNSTASKYKGEKVGGQNI
jgi:hypothetical protein